MERKYYAGRDIGRALSIADLRVMAKKRLPGFAFEFLEGGAEDEVTLAWNRVIFRTMRFIPRTLRRTDARHTRIPLFDREASSPLIIAPTGYNGLMRHRGDVCLAQAAAALDIPFTLSTLSNIRLEDLRAACSGRLWMQLYIFNDRELTLDIVRRAERAGYEALVLTTDANVYGWREWDQRNFRAPGRLTLRCLADLLRHPRWLFDVLVPHGVPLLENVIDFFPADARDSRGAVTHIPKLLAPTITWNQLAQLRDLWPRKLIVKGILDVGDARRAAELGCDGIVVTNHGARHLDSSVSPMEVLPAIAEAVGDRLTIIVDSGFRRGSDVVKAIALGADAVMIGRAALYGLAAGGEAGVRHAVGLLNSEIHRVLGQIGCNSLSEVGPEYLDRNAAETVGI